jgi:hypothetical protein
MNMKYRAFYGRFARAACLGLFAGLIWNPPAEAHTVQGRAFAAFVNAPTLGAGPFYLVDSGELSPNGGWEGAGLLSAQVPNVLAASVLNSASSGTVSTDSGQANSSASLADVTVLPGHVARLSASFVRSQVEATDFGSRGSTEIHDLTFGGTAIPVTGQPNQTVALPGAPILGLLGQAIGTGPSPAELIINEQVVTSDGTSQAITVNALHLVLATGEEVILGSASSLVNPAGLATFASSGKEGARTSDSNRVRDALWRSNLQPPIVLAHPPGAEVCIDFVTGGGFFEPPHSTRPGRVNFGFNAGPRSVQNPDIKGHLNLVDHFDGSHLKGINVDFYEVVSPDPEHCRRFGGDATFNGVPGHRYVAGVCDYGEPGRDDRFVVDVTLGGSAVYSADNFDGSPSPFGGELDGGNIQLHTNPRKCFTEATFRGEENLARAIGPLRL